jgi:hypothetical protein
LAAGVVLGSRHIGHGQAWKLNKKTNFGDGVASHSTIKHFLGKRSFSIYIAAMALYYNIILL